MEAIGRIPPAAANRRLIGQASSAVVAQPAAIPSVPSTALVPTEAGERPSLQSRRPSAAFLAHLIATRAQDPQTRARRRAEPAEATAAYGNLAGPGAASGRCCAVRA